MHSAQTVCTETGMPASPYCPQTEVRGIVTIPAGHPLYSLLGTEYQEVISQYLGTAAAWSGTTCSLHSSGYTAPSSTTLDAGRLANARQLLSDAEQKLATMDPTSEAYLSLRQAADDLLILLSGPNPDDGAVLSAMSALTQALLGIY